MIIAERAARTEAEARATRAVAENSNRDALIAHLKLQIEKLRRELYGIRSERKARLLDQMELQLEDLETGATEDEIAAEQAAARAQTVRSFERKRPARKAFPAHLPRERVVIPAPECCPGCGSAQFSKLGEDVTETLEVIPRRWKVIQTVREKFSCRACETISQPPAPYHVTPRGFAGPNLLAMILFEKFGQHQPLNRQSERYRREGIDLSVSTLADQVGACTAALRPLHDLIQAHVLSAERLHADDTTVPILAKGKTVLDDGRICLTNNAAERALRGFALGRKSWLFAGSERGADRAAAMTTLITTAKLNDIDPLAWLADVLTRIAETPRSRLSDLLPWNWAPLRLQVAA